MGADIKAAIIAAFGAPQNEVQLTKFCNAIGKAVVENIKMNAQVPPGIAVVVNPGNGVGATTGPGTVI
jgi:hypothetical protein